MSAPGKSSTLIARRSSGAADGVPGSTVAERVERLFFGVSETHPSTGWNQLSLASCESAWKSSTEPPLALTAGKPDAAPRPPSYQTRTDFELARASVPPIVKPCRVGQPNRNVAGSVGGTTTQGPVTATQFLTRTHSCVGAGTR